MWLLSSQNGLADLTGNENANQPMIKKRNDLNAVFFYVSEFESGRAVKSGLDPTLMGLVCNKTGVRRR